MICQRIKPDREVNTFIKEYLLLHVIFDKDAAPPVKSYPVNPEEGLTFVVHGSLHAEDQEKRTQQKRPSVTLFGQPINRQNLYISHEYMMIHVRFQPGGLFKMLKIPMTELVHSFINAEFLFGNDIIFLNEELAATKGYHEIPFILDRYFAQKIRNIKPAHEPIDHIGKMILHNPQDFNLEKTAGQACLSYRQFEKRFTQQIGITPKYFARICRFYQAYELKEFHPELDWLSVAVQTGYNDYQHLVKDFKQFAGTTPNVLIRESHNNPERRLKLSNDFRGL